MAQPEFTSKQIDRIDKVHDAVYEMCCVMCGDRYKAKLPYEVSYIAEVAETVAEILTEHKMEVHFPTRYLNEDGTYTIEEIWR